MPIYTPPFHKGRLSGRGFLGTTSTTPAVPDPMLNVSRDAQSMVYVPSTLAQWETVFTVAGMPGLGAFDIWLNQETSGNPTSVVNNLICTVSGVVSYDNIVAGWSRRALGVTDGVAGECRCSLAGLPDLASTDIMVMSYDLVSASTVATRSLTTIGTTVPGYTFINASGRLVAMSNATSVAGVADVRGQVRPTLLQSNRTDAVFSACNDLERITPAFQATMTGKRISIYGVNAPPTARRLYTAMFTGASARLTAPQQKLLLETLGWSPTWSA